MGVFSKLSIILPVYKNQPAAERVIKHLLKEKPDEAEIIVIDSSPDPMTSAALGSVRYVFSKERLFAGAARNLGAQKSDRQWLHFLDSDCKVVENFFTKLAELMKSHPNIQAFNGCVEYEQPSSKIDFSLHLFEFHEFTSSIKMPLRFLHSGNLVIHRSLFNRAGGFREDIPMCTDFTFTANLPQNLASCALYSPCLGIRHLAHFTEEWAIKEKIKKMGYWRGFVDLQIPEQLSIQKRFSIKILMRLRLLFALIFAAAIFWRAFKLRSIYLKYFFTHISRLVSFSWVWAEAFELGAEDGSSITDPRLVHGAQSNDFSTVRGQIK